MMKKFRYILRFTLLPDYKVEENLEKLLKFCRRGLIEEVAFSINTEEMNVGHIPLEEIEPWLNVVKKGRDELEKYNIEVSLYSWETLLHCDRGRKLFPGQNFTTMVDLLGNRAQAVACPLSSEWQEYIVEKYRRLSEIKPHILWIEDDFRIHNHSPLIWGGGFCELHLEEYSRRLGRKVEREEFVRELLKEGVPTEERRVWLEVNGEIMNKVVKKISEAVHEVSPSTRMGLMTSIPSTHASEGR
ncbi:hypothetical protein J7K43_00030, partial [Candidatus Calescamantes bacterium]|nr:hypothetical protein [Candidatus Calescamantes bacterium]